MKRLWVQLSFAFSFVLILSQLISFFSLVGLAYFSPDVFVGDYEYIPFTYEEAVGIWVSDQLYTGATSAEIEEKFWQEKDNIDIAELISRTKVEIEDFENSESSFSVFPGGFVAASIISDSETVTDSDAIVIENVPASPYMSLLDFPLALFFNESTIRVIIQSLIIGVIAGVFTSRFLVKPLGDLIEAVQAFGKRDMSQRVQVKGSQEIEELMITFNNMADELEKAEQLRLNIFADVSHELRTPLTGLEGNLRASLDHVYELDERHVANMVLQTQHLIHLVEDLRLLAQAEARQLPLEYETVDVNLLVQDTVDMFSIQAEESNVALTAVLPPNSPTIQADTNRIRQVLHNLISNALRHTEENGRVQVMVKQQGSDVVFSVQDNGAGIDADHLPYVFDRFYRTDKARSRDKGGTGLGLAITKALVEAHDGSIEALSDGTGFGSTFCFLLPQ